LGSKDPKDPPLINPNFFSHTDDLVNYISIFKECRRLMTHPLIINLTNGGEEISPGPKVTSDEDIGQWLRDSVMSDHHPTSTCKMGSSQDKMSVVDYSLRVYGVSNLRIVDASVIPSPINGNIYATVIAVAERASDFILLDALNTAPATPFSSRFSLWFWVLLIMIVFLLATGFYCYRRRAREYQTIQDQEL